MLLCLLIVFLPNSFVIQHHPTKSLVPLVLYDFKKLLRRFGLGIVIDRQFINIANFLVKAFFAGTDVADALQYSVILILTGKK
jgi:hypothetical protein